MKRIFSIICLLLLSVGSSQAAVAYDNSARTDGFGVTTLTTGAFTISSSANRVAIVCLFAVSGAVTNVTSSVGGVSGTAITGASGTNASSGSQIYCHQVIAPASGSQTATMSWTTARNATISVMTFTGAHQTTPVSAGGFVDSGFSATSTTGSITSDSGDMTFSFNACSAVDSAQTTNQTVKTTDWGRADIGPGSGSTTHTWSHAATQMFTAWGNVEQIAATGVARRRVVVN